MSVGLLTDAQVAALKVFRAKAWTRSFTIRTYPSQDVTDLYDDPAGSATDQVVKGDWTWKPLLGEAGSEGGGKPEGKLFLCCDLLYSGALINPTARILVDGRVVAPKNVMRAPDFQELVVEGVIVHG